MKYENVTVLIADGNPDSMGHALDIEGVTWPADGVPVTLGMEDGSPVVGHATLRRKGEGFEVVADIDLDDAEIGKTVDPDTLVPAAAGMGNPDLFDLEVQSIAVGEWKNADDRIGPLRPPPLTDEEGRPLRKRDPVPEGCEECPGCPDCLEYADLDEVAEE